MFNNPKIEHYIILYLNKEWFMYLFTYYIILYMLQVNWGIILELLLYLYLIINTEYFNIKKKNHKSPFNSKQYISLFQSQSCTLLLSADTVKSLCPDRMPVSCLPVATLFSMHTKMEV